MVESIGIKVVVWIVASVSVSALSYAIYRLIARARLRRFSNPRYSIGAAMVNMERAILYDDGENFKFFARYAIRTCLGMPRSYPPDEAPLEDVSHALLKSNIDENLMKRTMDVYLLGNLPNERKELEGILANTKMIVNDLLVALN